MSDWEFATVEQELAVTLTAYTAGDVVGGPITLKVPAIVNGGIVTGVTLVDEDNQSEAYNIWLHGSLPSTIANDAVYAPTVADLRKQFGLIALVAGDYTTLGSFAVAHQSGLNLVYQNDGEGEIYVYLEAVATPDYANTDALFLRLHIRTIK